MHLAEGVRLWLGATDATPARRALFLGAGFTRSCNPKSPLFWEYRDPLVERMRLASLERDFATLLNVETAKLDLMQLIEMADIHLDRLEIARLFLRNLQNVRGADAKTYLTLKQLLGEELTWLHVNSPHLILARLIAEGVIDEVLSTNWDAYVEHAAALVGLRVEDADDTSSCEAPFDALRSSVRVIETHDEMNLHWAAPTPGVTLYKLHGGVRSITRALDDADKGVSTAESQLRRSFLVSSSDLVQWRDHAEWIRDRVGATIRASAVFTIGVSGADTVTYDTFRRQIREWECSAEHRDTSVKGALGDGLVEARGVRMRLVASSPSPSLLLSNMVSVRRGPGLVDLHTVRSGGGHAMRAIYATWLLDVILRAAGEPSPVGEFLLGRLRRDLHDLERQEKQTDPPEEGKTRLLDLLALAIGPHSCWAGEIARVGPYVTEPTAVHGREKGRFWYAPWSALHERRRLSPETAAYLRDLLRRELERDDVERVNPRTGVLDLKYPSGPDGAMHELIATWPWEGGCTLEAPGLERLATDVATRLGKPLRETVLVRLVGWAPRRSFRRNGVIVTADGLGASS